MCQKSCMTVDKSAASSNTWKLPWSFKRFLNTHRVNQHETPWTQSEWMTICSDLTLTSGNTFRSLGPSLSWMRLFISFTNRQSMIHWPAVHLIHCDKNVTVRGQNRKWYQKSEFCGPVHYKFIPDASLNKERSNKSCTSCRRGPMTGDINLLHANPSQFFCKNR